MYPDTNGITQVPPLQHGDRLTRAEFERRYETMPHLKKAELIEGVVYMPSPVRLNQHGEPHQDLGTYIGIYRHFTPGTKGGDSCSVRLDMNNEPQPDVGLFIVGGNAWVDDDGYINGSPELVAEISASTVTLTWVQNSRYTNATASRNTWYGESRTVPSIGLSCAMNSTNA
jgi:hypothetical protein